MVTFARSSDAQFPAVINLDFVISISRVNPLLVVRDMFSLVTEDVTVALVLILIFRHFLFWQYHS